MKLDRNITTPRRGKYALIKLRDTTASTEAIKNRTFVVGQRSTDTVKLDVDLGDTEDSDFFVIRLKDKYAGQALRAYADAAWADGDKEYAGEIHDLARLAEQHPSKRKPD